MSTPPPGSPPPAPELTAALRRCKAALIGVGVASFLLNLLTLTGSFYMLQVYDRVIPSRSGATLLGLTLLLIFLYAAYGCFDVLRAQLLAGIGARLDRLLRARVFALHLALPLRSSRHGPVPQPLRDLDQIRSFIAGLGPTALFDLPGLPFFLVLIFCLHPWLGVLATLGGLIIVGLTLVTELRGRAPTQAAAAAALARQAFADGARRNGEVVWALGMRGALTARWTALSQAYFAEQEKAAGVVGALGAVSKVFRILLQSFMLGLGAYLVIHQEASGGVMIAASIMTGRALAPVDVAIANWRGFIAARDGYGRLQRLLAAAPAPRLDLALPPPAKTLAVENLAVGAPGDARAILTDVSFALAAGEGVGVIGPSAAGKSTLARALVGAWRPARGAVRLDGAALEQWDADALGAHIGYLPQDVELFDGSIAANIARYSERPEPLAVLAAAQAAGVHEMIACMPEGYSTKIGEGGWALSAGQRQRIGLARALYGDPFLVVLDEPNSNLDNDGEEALNGAIRAVRARGGVVVVVAHRPSALAAVDKVLVLTNGRVAAFGPREEVLRRTLREPVLVNPHAPSAPPLTAGARAQQAPAAAAATV